MKKMIFILALIIPLSAQDSTKIKESTPQKVVRHIQDADFRKFEAAHRRAHFKRGQSQTYVRESKRHNWKRTISYIVVGGLGYYIGTLEQNKKHRGGMKRRPYMGDKK